MKDNNYYNICGWMLNQLKLKGTALMIYAMIYSYYRSGIAEVNASLKYFAESVGCTEKTVSTTINNLVNKGLIFKEVLRGHDGGVRNTYKINYQILVDEGIMETEKYEQKAEKPKNFTPEMKKFPVATGKNFSTLPEKFSGGYIEECELSPTYAR